MSAATDRPNVAIVGGGLAGSAAAVALSQTNANITLFEARRQLGGRAASYREAASDELIDHCQHVSLGCCTNLDDLCRRTGLDGEFRLDDTLYFFPPTGAMRTLRASRWLPAPLHLAPGLLRLDYFSWRERLGIAHVLGQLARWRPAPAAEPTMLAWLQAQGQSPRAIELFWSVVLVSALGDTLDHVAVSPARKVFVDGFMASRGAYRVRVPLLPLAELFGSRLANWLVARGVSLHTASRVEQVGLVGEKPVVSLAGGACETFDAVIVAVPWRRSASLFAADAAARLPWLTAMSGWPAAPISGVHLWFDRPLTELPHAVLLGRLSQWLFNRGAVEIASDGAAASTAGTERAYYHQVVISASQTLAGRDKREVLAEVADELRAVFPDASGARLLRGRVVIEPEAVFSVAPGLDALRPAQRTGVPGLFLAGDWTATGWPATMEGAVRSGYLAAEAVCAESGEPRRFRAPDLPRSVLARWLLPG